MTILSSGCAATMNTKTEERSLALVAANASQASGLRAEFCRDIKRRRGWGSPPLRLAMRP
jgi:hypothetical protein